MLNKYPFIENFIYAEIVSEIPNKKYQERLIFDKLMTSLRWESTFAASGYLVNSVTCNDGLKYTSSDATFITDKIVSFTRTEITIKDIFPIEVIKTYTNSETFTKHKTHLFDELWNEL